MEYISYDEFKKMDIRVGIIREVEPVPETDKLLKCQIDFGETEEVKELDEEGNVTSVKTIKKLRQIISGIHEYYPDPSVLIGKQVLYIVNLEPRTIKGYVSNGMLLALDGPSNTETGEESKPVFLVPETKVDAGSKVR